MIDLDELERLLAAATAEPWMATDSEEYRGRPSLFYNEAEDGPLHGLAGADDDAVYTVSTHPDYSGWETDSGCPGYGISRANAELIAALRNSAAKLIQNARACAEIRRVIALGKDDGSVGRVARRVIAQEQPRDRV